MARPGGAVRIAALGALALAASQAHAICTFGGSGEPSLQATLDDLLGGDTVDVVAACIPDGSDAAWSTVGQVGTVEIQIELAGNASTNTFGIYDFITGAELRLFEGNDRAGAVGRIQIRQQDGQWQARVRDFSPSPEDRGSTAWNDWTNISSSAFGFYLATRNGTFYSRTQDNADGQDHLYAYELGGNFAGEYLMAWEDLFGGGDRDYQDFVATLQDVTPVPLPTALWLLASGLIGFAGVARRRG
jgi:Domain of unknown function (DUF4114)